MPAWAVALTILSGVGAGVGILWFAWWVIERFRLPPITKPELDEALRRQRQEIVQEVSETFDHWLNVPRGPTTKLVDELPVDRVDLLRKAAAAQGAAKYREAIEYLRQCDYPGMSPGERATLHLLMGNSYAYLSELRDAEREYAEALSAARQAKDRDTEAALLGNRGVVYHQRGELDKAEEHYNKALKIAREIGNRRGEAADLGNLGLVYAERGDLDKAEEHHQKAMEIHREIGDRLGEANDLGNLGIIHRERGDPQKAEEHLKQVLDIHREIGSRLGEGRDLYGLGNVYADRGEMDKAEASYEQALAIHREIGNRLDEANVLGNLGIVFLRRGDTKKARDYLQQAQDIYREIGAGGEGPENVRRALERIAEQERGE